MSKNLKHVFFALNLSVQLYRDLAHSALRLISHRPA
jgi:hypothetical protein